MKVSQLVGAAVAGVAAASVLAGCSSEPSVDECRQMLDQWGQQVARGETSQNLFEKLEEVNCTSRLPELFPPQSAAVPSGTTEQPPVVLGFGEQHALNNGAQVSMIAAVVGDWEPTEQIPGDMVKLTVTVTNNSNAALDPTQLNMSELSSPDGGPVQAWAFGKADGFREAQGDLFPGETVTFDRAVEMADASGTLRVKLDENVYVEGVPTPVGAAPPTAETYVDPLEGADEGAPPPPNSERDWSCTFAPDGTQVCEGNVPPSVGEYTTPEEYNAGN